MASPVTPELYRYDLEVLQKVMGALEEITSDIDELFSVEIRVKTDDISTWIVIGWGESGDPCVLRFERDEPVKAVNPKIHLLHTEIE